MCLIILKVVFFGDNVPKDRADKAMEAAKGCDAFLVLGSSLMTMSAFRLVRYILFLLFVFMKECCLPDNLSVGKNLNGYFHRKPDNHILIDGRFP